MHGRHRSKSSLRSALIIHLLLWILLLKLLLLELLLRSGLVLAVLKLLHVDCWGRGVIYAVAMNTDGDHDE